jgi:hypothetical protein
VLECPTSWIKDACALRRLGHPRNIPIKQGYKLSLQKSLHKPGPLQWAKFYVGLRVGRGRETERPRRRPSSYIVLDEGWRLPVVLSPLVQRNWQRHRAKGSVFAFALTFALRGTSSTKSSGAEGIARWWRRCPRSKWFRGVF